MPQTMKVLPGPGAREVRLADGETVSVPEGWVLLPPGDATLTRRVKAAGPSWTVQEKRGRKTFSQGVWAPPQHVDKARADLETERATPAYQKRLEAGRRRRDAAQAKYVQEFRASVMAYLAFASQYDDLGACMADRITAHATPVGSGTVARTSRIPVERRAEAAVIAWMRHQTTAYDGMVIPRQKGARREVRRMLARRSKTLLARYRSGQPVASDCPLQRALQG